METQHLSDALTLIQEHWKDEHGGIANAIFDLSAQDETKHGLFNDRQGRPVVWNYNKSFKLLSYHILDQGTWHVDQKKAELVDERGFEARTIYRPYMTGDGDEIKWRITREVKIHKYNHSTLTPVYLEEAHYRIRKELETLSLHFKKAKLGNLLPPIHKNQLARTNEDIFWTYQTFCGQALKGVPLKTRPGKAGWEKDFFDSLIAFHLSLPESVRDPKEDKVWLIEYWRYTLIQEMRDVMYETKSGLLLMSLYMALIEYEESQIQTTKSAVRHLLFLADNEKELRWFKDLYASYLDHGKCK